MELSHLDKAGQANMVDISAKDIVKRTAMAKGRIVLKPETIELLQKGLLQKGDALATARIAGIQAAKKTWELVPLCHNIVIDQVRVDFQIQDNGIEFQASATCSGKTGIEMEVITAVSMAAITIYDMCKAVDKEMKIMDIRLVEKRKGEEEQKAVIGNR